LHSRSQTVALTLSTCTNPTRTHKFNPKLGEVHPPLSSGEIPSFHDQRETRRCDWLNNTHNLEIQTEHIHIQ